MIKAEFNSQSTDPLSGENYSGGESPSTAGPRAGNFAHGAMSHALGDSSLQQVQNNYAATIPHKYIQAGIQQIGENAKSAVSLGVNPAGGRFGTFNGQSYLLSSNVGRSEQTAQAKPVFDSTPGASQSPSQSQSLQPAQYSQPKQ